MMDLLIMAENVRETVRKQDEIALYGNARNMKHFCGRI